MSDDDRAIRQFTRSIIVTVIATLLGMAWIIHMNIVHNWGCP